MASARSDRTSGRLHDLKGLALGPAIGVYNLFLFAVLDRPPFVPTDDFPWVAELESNWTVIREELDDLLENGPEVPPYLVVDPSQKRFWEAAGSILRRVRPSTDPDQLKPDSWRTFVFRTYGRDVPPNRALCPRTAALVDDVPNVVGAMFSVLEPGGRLPLHFGLFPGALRYHLGLRVSPGGLSAIRVAGIEQAWTEGESFIFEHSRWHTAWNESSEVRVILILDVERPMPWRWLGRLNHAMVVNLRTWRRTREAVAHIEALTATATSQRAVADGEARTA